MKLIRRIFPIIAVLTFLFLVSVSSAATPALDRNRLLAEAEAAFGHRNFALFQVPVSTGPVNEALVGVLSGAFGPRSVARQLGTFVAPAQTRAISVAVAGPSSQKTKTVIIESLNHNRDKRLPGLTLLFFGWKQDRDAVQRAVESHGGKFLFRPLPSI
jgi:hypothetical protein